MKTRASVVIIGGGIIGTSIAYHLALRGVRDVVLVEADGVGSGSSGKSAAMILLQQSREMTIRLSQESFKEYLGELDADIGYRPTGFMNLATPAIADEVHAQVKLQRQLGVPVEVLSPDDIQRIVPALKADDLAFASICWQDGEIDPHSVMQTYVQRARQRGVEINEQVEATGIQIAKGRVVGVQTKAGLIVASTVINAAGARAAQVASWVGVNLPIKNFKRTIFITDRFDEIPASMPFVMDLSVEWYFRKERQGILLGMGTEESTAFEPKFEWDYLTTITQHALHRDSITATSYSARVQASRQLPSHWALSSAARQSDCGTIHMCRLRGGFSCRLLLGRLITLIYNARWKRGGFDEFQTDMLACGEQPLAAAKHQWIDMQSIFIYQIILYQSMK